MPKAPVSVVRRVPKRDVRLAREASARVALAGLEQGTEVFCLTFGQFSLLDAIQVVLDKVGPADVDISTWTAASADLSKAKVFLKDGRIKRLRFLVDRSFKTRQPDYFNELQAQFGEDSVREMPTHAKFVAISGGGWYVAIFSSMNLNQNGRLETICVSTDKALCLFLISIMNDAFLELPLPGLAPSNSMLNFASIPDVVGPSQVSNVGAVGKMGTVTI